MSVVVSQTNLKNMRIVNVPMQLFKQLSVHVLFPYQDSQGLIELSCGSDG